MPWRAADSLAPAPAPGIFARVNFGAASGVARKLHSQSRCALDTFLLDCGARRLRAALHQYQYS